MRSISSASTGIAPFPFRCVMSPPVLCGNGTGEGGRGRSIAVPITEKGFLLGRFSEEPDQVVSLRLHTGSAEFQAGAKRAASPHSSTIRACGTLPETQCLE